MRHRKPRRFRRRMNDRGHSMINNSIDQVGLGNNSFINGRGRNNFKPHQSAEKLVEKYSTLAKEALSSGDRILSESYFQYADHFIRIVKEKNLNKNLSAVSLNPEATIPQKSFEEKNLTDKKKEETTDKKKEETTD